MAGGQLAIESRGVPEAGPVSALEPDDLTLVSRAATDREAFALLYERYSDRIYAFCYRRLGSREAAEDATSQTFVKLLTALQKPNRRTGSVRSWIFTIAWHVMIDGFRTSHPHADLSIVPETADPAVSPIDQVLAIETATDLDALIRQLPGDGPTIVHLRLAGLTDREIAAVLGKSHGAIRTAQHRAFIRLRELAQAARIDL